MAWKELIKKAKESTVMRRVKGNKKDKWYDWECKQLKKRVKKVEKNKRDQEILKGGVQEVIGKEKRKVGIRKRGKIEGNKE